MRVETTSEISCPPIPVGVGQVRHGRRPTVLLWESVGASAGGGSARTPNLLPAPSSRRIPPNAGGCAGESSGVGRSVNKVAGVATLTSQAHPYVWRGTELSLIVVWIRSPVFSVPDETVSNQFLVDRFSFEIRELLLLSLGKDFIDFLLLLRKPFPSFG